jgi:hypothetical protein
VSIARQALGSHALERLMAGASFDLDQYRELIAAAQAGGYSWARFDHEPAPGDLFMRHDVDLSLEAALVMGRLEHELGVDATYFLMTGSDFYNLDSPVGRYVIRQLRQWGHGVGQHPNYPNLDTNGRFDNVLSWHNPEPEYMSALVDGVVNVMGPPYFVQGHYRSDSNQHWREGSPLEELAAGEFEWLHLLVHPEIWVYEGETMRQTMESMLDAKRDDWLGYLANDRIDLT